MGRALNSARVRLEQPLVIAAAGTLLAIAIGPPLLHIGSELGAASDAIVLLADTRLWWLLLRSVTLAAAITVGSLLAGVPLGVFFARTDFSLRALLFAAHLAIVFLPPLLPALGWFHIFGRQGLLGNPVTSRLLFSEFGMILVLTTCFTPIVTALSMLGVRGVDASLEEAARIAGGPLRTAAFVLVPVAAPAITLAGFIVFTLALAELGVPMFLRVDVYPAVVFARLGGMDFAPGEAAVFVVPLALVALLLLAVERRYAGRRALASLTGTRASSADLFHARGVPFLAALAAALTSCAPILAILASALSEPGFRQLWRWAGDAPWNGLRASGLSAAVMAVIALVLGRELARRTRAGVWFDAAAMLAFVVPSSILGVGVVGAWNRPATSFVYASQAVLVLGFVARYSIVATRTVAAVLTQVNISLEEVAATVGASYAQRLALLVRIAPRGLIAAFLFAWVSALRDLETAALFYPPGGEPLTVRIFTLEANGPPAVVSALSVLHIAITFAVVSAGAMLLRRARNT